MKVAISGKGGSGKTTLSGTFARLAGRGGSPVLAIDADTNPNLALTLGLSREVFEAITPLPHGLMDHRRVNGEVHLALSRPVEQVEAEFGVDCPDNVRLLLLGAPRGAGTG
ncbi:MAG: AAA family ATPase [Actinomycetota bacterium]